MPGVPGGWLSLMCQLLARGVFRALDFSGIRISLLLIVDNYNQAAKSNHKGTKAQRTPKEIRGGPPAYRSLRARGPAAPGSSSTMYQAVRARLTCLRMGALAGSHMTRMQVWAFSLGERENVTAFSGNSDLYSRYTN